MKRHVFLIVGASLALGGCGDGAVGASGAGGYSAPPPATCGYDVLGGLDLQTATVLDLQRALDGGAFTSVDLVRHQLALISAFDATGPTLNSVRAIAPGVLAQASAADARRRLGRTIGPLDGVTVFLKDNVGTTDLPTTAGSIALATNVPLREATITRRLRESGAIVLGKTNLSEFAYWMDPSMPSGYSSLGGQVASPFRADLDPLGSSTGSAVAATMGFSTVAIGTETSGSIIAPSHRNALVGVKPTLGLVSRVGIIPLSPSFDTAGPMARNVVDAAALLQVLAHADPEDPFSSRFAEALGGVTPDYLGSLSATALEGARIGVRDADTSPAGQIFWETLNGAPSDLFNGALDVLRAQGAVLVAINEPPDPVDFIPSTTGLVANFNEFKFSINRYLAEESGPDTIVETLSDIIAYNGEHPDEVKYGQTYLELSDAQSGSEVDPLYLATRDATILSAQAYLDGLMQAYGIDAIVSWNVGQSNIIQTAAAGYPNLTVPIGFDESKVPHGLQFAGRPFDEARLLAYAYDFELGMKGRRSPPQVNTELISECPP